MIKTVQEVAYNPVDLNKTAIVFAEVLSANRNDKGGTYTLNIREWIEEVYTENVPIEGGGMEEQTFTKQKEVRRTTRTMTFAETDALTDYIDANFQLAETKTARRKRYTELGHLLVNNQENVCNVQWEEVL